MSKIHLKEMWVVKRISEASVAHKRRQSFIESFIGR